MVFSSFGAIAIGLALGPEGQRGPSDRWRGELTTTGLASVGVGALLFLIEASLDLGGQAEALGRLVETCGGELLTEDAILPRGGAP